MVDEKIAAREVAKAKLRAARRVRSSIEPNYVAVRRRTSLAQQLIRADEYVRVAYIQVAAHIKILEDLQLERALIAAALEKANG